jgi:hypothetical protein
MFKCHIQPRNHGSIPSRDKIFLFSKRPVQLWGILSLLASVYWALYSGGAVQPGRETRHSLLSNVCTGITSPFTFGYCINIGHCGICGGTEHSFFISLRKEEKWSKNGLHVVYFSLWIL